VSRPLAARWLGRVPYAEALALQERLVDAVRHGAEPDTLLLLEHAPVITTGRDTRPGHILLSPEELAARGVEVHDVGRGGDVTFHGYGQLVGYPVIALRGARRDLRRYMGDLEEALILTAADFGVRAGRITGLTGVWVGDRKLAALGVRVSAGWIAWHGFALNVGADVSGFDAILPCGLAGKGVTSIALETGLDPGLEEVARRAAAHVADVLGAALSSSALGLSRRRPR
jgi:lipoyl(octanoyl) transferase